MGSNPSCYETFADDICDDRLLIMQVIMQGQYIKSAPPLCNPESHCSSSLEDILSFLKMETVPGK